MLAMIRLSSGTGGTTVVGVGINVGGWLVAVGSGDIVRADVESDIVATESAVQDAQAGNPVIITMRTNPGLELSMKRPPFDYTFVARLVPE